jgi:hypothetical protein
VAGSLATEDMFVLKKPTNPLWNGHLWRGGLPPFGCEAAAKMPNAV